MERRPTSLKTIQNETELQIPVNYRENLLFCLLGMLTALIVGLSFYEEEVSAELQLQPPSERSPASFEPPSPNSDHSKNFNPYEHLPSLY